MKRTIKACPFCGDRGELYTAEHVECYGCGAVGPQADPQEGATAVELWNRRVTCDD